LDPDVKGVRVIFDHQVRGPVLLDHFIKTIVHGLRSEIREVVVEFHSGQELSKSWEAVNASKFWQRKIKLTLSVAISSLTEYLL
jgi:hypothetical protein